MPEPAQPYVSYAVFCEDFKHAPDGTVTIERVTDTLTWIAYGDGGDQAQTLTNPPKQSLTYAVCFKSAVPMGPMHCELWKVSPSGKRDKIGEKSISLPGNHGGLFLSERLDIELDEEGIQLYEVLLDGSLIARIPITLRLVKERIALDRSQGLCPCNSGKLLRDCCLSSDGVIRRSVARMEVPRGTGRATSICYAAGLGGCAGGPSREHYITEALLKQMEEHGPLKVSGFPWQSPGEIREVSSRALVGKVLCKRHNSALSALDTAASRFYGAIESIEREFADPDSSDTDRIFLLNGEEIERWMLKTLCGLVFSENALTPGGPPSGWTPPIEWLQILYGLRRFPDDWGVYFLGQAGEGFESHNGMQYAAIGDSQNVHGAVIGLRGFRFVMVMATPPEDKQATLLASGIHRPRQFRVTNGRAEKVIDFGWDNGQVVMLSYTQGAGTEPV